MASTLLNKPSGALVQTAMLRSPNAALMLLRFTAIIAALMGLVRPALADNIDRLIVQLKTAEDYKVRLSAALNLAKAADQRSVSVFIDALDDSDKTVRGVSAAALGKLLNSSTTVALRERALERLKSVAAKDPNSFVKRQAQKAYDVIKRLDATAVEAGGVYVDLGAMTAKTDDEAQNGKLRQLMRQTAQKTFARHATAMMTNWPGGQAPTKAQLDAKKASGYHVDGTLTEMQTVAKGSMTVVSCKISMLLATFPGKSMFGFLNGGASVQAGSTQRDIDFAREDCVVAVVEDLVAKKIIPTIETRAK